MYLKLTKNVVVYEGLNNIYLYSGLNFDLLTSAFVTEEKGITVAYVGTKQHLDALPEGATEITLEDLNIAVNVPIVEKESAIQRINNELENLLTEAENDKLSIATLQNGLGNLLIEVAMLKGGGN